MERSSEVRRRGLPVALAPALLFLGACSGAPQGSRPNLVLIVADDQDPAHLGFAGHPRVQTPTLDRLAAEGTVFRVAHATAPRCRPALASLLSGRLPHQHGIFYNEGEGNLDPAGSLPRRLREAGYATFLGGKFWEGDPEVMGFEASAVGDGFAREGQAELQAFLEQNAGQRPVFVWWAPKLPHFPHDPPQAFVDALDLQEIPVPPWFELPAWEGIDAVEYRFSELMVLATVAWFDDCVRELVEMLESAGIRDDTLVCYLIDNGSANGLVSKGSPFEKGLATPVLLSWPGRVPTGVRRDELVSAVDVYATLLDYAGLEPPAQAAGPSLRPFVEGLTGEPRDALHGAVYPRQARPGNERPERNVLALYARTPRWKYVLWLQRVDPETADAFRIKHDFAPPVQRRRGDEDLYDLEADPHELVDLAEKPAHAELVARLRAGALRWWEETGGGPLRLP